MSYDIRGRKVSMTDPDMGYWTYAYDALGNLINQRDAKGQSTTMVYDLLGRLTSRTEAEGTSRWTYDTLWTGALSSETNGVTSKAYIYDTFGRVKSVATTINGQTYNVGTSYDTIGRVNTITYPTGLTIQRNYNAFGFLQSVSNAASGALIWQANSMDEFGHLTGESFGNGVITTHVFDNVRGVLTGLQSTSGGVQIQNWSYDYDAVGNMKFRTDAVVGYTERFGYDNLNRLTNVKNAAGVLQKQYQYDAIGNITYKSDVGYYAYDPYHPHAVSTAGNNTYAYDANGNQTSGAGRSFTWTSFNKPSGISTANGYTGFSYDANHNRVLKTTPMSTTAYIGKIYQQTTMNGVIKDVSNIYAGSKLVASIEEVAGLSTIKYMHGDHLGSISVITDANGAVIERLRFDVFGAPVDPNTGAAKASFGANNTDRGYTGHEMDASTGLINMNARLYDPVLGRFISADTVIPEPGNMQAFNRYSYVLNNPLAYTDPTGHSWWTNFRDSVLKPVATVIVVAALAYFTAGYAMAAYANAAGISVAGATAGTASFTGATASFGALSSASLGTAMAGGFVGGAISSASFTAIAGGNLSQIGHAALMGGIGGAIGAGVGYGLGGEYLGKMAGQAANAGVQTRGDLKAMGRAFVIAGGAAAMNYIYKSITGVDPTWNRGKGLASSDGSYVESLPLSKQVTNANIFGTNQPLRGHFFADFFKQGGALSVAANNVLPAAHGISVIHDVFQLGFDSIAGSHDSWLRSIGNVPAMLPAAAITYGGLIGNNSVVVDML